ncbi:MAG: TonB-dependent receptor [Alphaproteobacteria bacterium]|nr:TonB-dependent receptor [Alphaproteobacteria bacterium]
MTREVRRPAFRRRPHPAGTSLRCGERAGIKAFASLRDDILKMSFEEEEKMHPILLLAAFAASPPAPLEPDQTIVVTGSREPTPRAEAPVSATIFDEATIAALALPMTADLLRLSPGVSVATSGPRGTQTQLRIRGAEANHTLLFVDGIRFNDPAAGNEARFELLANDALSRVEVVRGPQSALWGSEALGGVVALDSADPSTARGLSALGEIGSLQGARASAQAAAQAGSLGIAASAGWLHSEGVDSVGRGGERDGFDNRSASLKAVLKPLPSLEFGLVGHWIEGLSEFDGFDPVTFRRAETLDETRNRVGAVRSWGSFTSGGWLLKADASWLGSTNRNFLGDSPLNRTAGERFTAGAQASRTFGGQELIAAIEHQSERFHARDQSSFGATDQDRSRRVAALVGEWRSRWTHFLSTDLAVRRDWFSAFADATTLRAAAIVAPGGGWRLHAAYGEGIAQPSFYDLYGFFPGSFQGNPALRPERSKGWEAGLRWQGAKVLIGVTGFSNRLRDEILDVFDPVTFLSSTANASGRSSRRGVEVEAEYRPVRAVLLAANYTWLDASEQQVAGTARVREVRRPRHTANLVATGTSGRFSWGASGAYVGARTDNDFDFFPAPTIRLHPYLLASARVGWRIGHGLEAYLRAENAFDAHYQDVVGYHTPGRTVDAGFRVCLGG